MESQMVDWNSLKSRTKSPGKERILKGLRVRKCPDRSNSKVYVQGWCVRRDRDAGKRVNPNSTENADSKDGWYHLRVTCETCDPIPQICTSKRAIDQSGCRVAELGEERK